MCESIFYFLGEDVSSWASSSSEEVLSILGSVSGGERPPETSWPRAQGEQWCRGPEPMQLGHVQGSPCPPAKGERWRWGAAGTLGMGQTSSRGRDLRKVNLLGKKTGECWARLWHEGVLSA